MTERRCCRNADLSRTECQVLDSNLQEQVGVEALEVLHSERQPLQGGEVGIHRIVQQVGHLVLGLPALHGQHCTQIQ